MPGHTLCHWLRFRCAPFISSFSMVFVAYTFGGEPQSPNVTGVVMVQSVVVLGTIFSVNLATQAGQPYDARAIEVDVRRLWNTARFDDIRVETVPAAHGIAVTYHLREAAGLRLREVRIQPHTFGLRLKHIKGTPIDRIRAHEIAQEARKQLNALGYLDARVDYHLVPLSKYEADLCLTVRAGEAVDVKGVEFRGDAGLDVKELRRALHTMRIRRVLPGIPALWSGWRLFPAYSPEAVDSDLGRLRSLYLSKSYFDARVVLESAEIRGKTAKVHIFVQSGRQYRVGEWTMSGDRIATQQTRPDDGLLHAGDLCSCLLTMRRAAERAGILDFSARLKIQRVENESGGLPIANLTASVEEGQPYRIARVEFTGNHRYKDATVRRNLLLDEGQWLDWQLLRKSLRRLNQTMQFDPLDENAVAIHPDPKTGEADVTVRLTERQHRAGALSGPVGPMSFAGPLEASLTSRLPPWGQGLLELSTYTVSVSLLASAHPLLPIVSSKRLIVPVLALQRPFSPSEGWRSGFVLAPQIGWRRSTLSYAATQMQHRLLPMLAGDSDLEPELPVTVERPGVDGVMLCQPPGPRFAGLRTTAGLGVRLLSALSAIY